ncbi:MAG: 1-deoxy-D-xylulose-5-phosphate reductoisomerase [Terriglobia bacterium]
MKGLCILGSTGSVGCNTLRVVKDHPGRFRVVSLAAGKNLDLLAEQIDEFHPQLVSVHATECLDPLRGRLEARGYRAPLEIEAGTEGQTRAATHPEVDIVVSSAHGVTGLRATYEAVRAGKRIGLANKETLVVAGEIVMRAAREMGAEILPIDSEHSAVHQCLRSGHRGEVRRLILTGSGGPFRKTSAADLDAVTPERALAHPVWKMGSRITIDSATLMNKGLEIIEAHWLFGFPPAQIDVLIHPESIVHSMIEFQDGSVVAQLSVADMRLPIQYALTHPERVAMSGDSLRLDLLSVGRLHFESPDSARFPCLDLARAALRQGGGMPAALNAADEVAVEAFLAGKLRFSSIPRVIEQVLKVTPRAKVDSIEDVLACDAEARNHAREQAARFQV